MPTKWSDRARRIAAAAIVLALLDAGGAVAQQGADALIQDEVEVIWGARIPMRDRVELHATIYKPRLQDGPLPVIFWLTPYIADLSHERGVYFARNGYVFVNVDTRGRGNSGGEFEPFVHEARDGREIVEWLARQPFSNGKVGAWGGSYGGFFQWAILKDPPPQLLAVAPVASALPGIDFPNPRNIFMSYAIQWATLTSGRTGQWRVFGDGRFWDDVYRRRYLDHRPFVSLDTLAGNLTTVFQKWLQHPMPDAYWDAMTPTAEEYARIDLPVLTITGYYDGDQLGALTYYRRHMDNASPAARARHFLVIGPWDHPGTRTPVKELGGLVFADTSVLDMNRLHKEWYDWTMKDGPKPAFLKDRVAYFGAGGEQWKYAPSVEAISDSTLRLFLDSDDGRANSVFHSGHLRAGTTGSGAPDSYVYDPLDTRRELVPRTRPAEYLRDQSAAFELNGDGLVYHTEPFEHDTEITGFPKLTLWISMDVPDTDFAVSLDQILPDGSAVHLSSDMLRARHRESLRAERLVTPGEVTRLTFDHFFFFSRLVSEGSRLRLTITSPNTSAWQKNYNSGGDVARESAADARTARIRIHHDAEHPSVLELPVVRAGRNEATQ